MRVLVIGSGGREHALCWALAASPLLDQLFCAPGNAGIAEDATCVPIPADDFDGIVGFCRNQAVDLVVVGPEAPLVAGLVDRLDAEGIRAFGPSAAAAELEGSKAFTKELCRQQGIPTAAWQTFDDADAARAHVRSLGAPVVVKADGLAAGKGVTVAATVEEALDAIDRMAGGGFGAAGRRIVVEECLVGEEASFFALVDGRTVLPLAAAQDHKRAHDGDTGPNTGGMGAYSPAPPVDAAKAERILREIVRPTAEGMAAMGRPFRGVLYAGLMLTDAGPKLIEYNVRFGDPECQVLMARLKSDLLPALLAVADGVLDTFDLRWHDEAALTVVLASRGYPGDYRSGTPIGDLAAARAVEGVTVFHAGTALSDGRLVATGGRVLGVTATAPSLAEARERAYRAVDLIDWPDGFCRRDIGARGVPR